MGRNLWVMVLHLIQYFLVVLVLSNIACSQTIIKTLPGFPTQLPFKLETGYTGLGEREDLQLFYYFVESERNPENDPLIIWINGGPGCSALWPFFFQIGPLKFDYPNCGGQIPMLELNSYSWTKVASIIFVDASGAGFSYAKTMEAYKTSDTLTAAYIYEFLRKWLNIHPNFLSNPLYIAGVSYAGVQIPAVVQDIFLGNEAGNDPKLNIKGYLGGNPLTDRKIDFNSRIEYAYQFALLSDKMYKSTKAACKGEYQNVNPSNALCQTALQEVDKCLKDINEHQILEPMCPSEMTSTQKSMQWVGRGSPLRLRQAPESWCRGDNYEYATTWASDPTVKKALHVREGTIEEWVICNTDHYSPGRNDTETYKYDITSSIVYHQNLTQKDCRALIFSGDHDMVFPYVGTRKWIHALNLTVDRTWTPWFVNSQVAGYTEVFSHDKYSLTYATVKGAGHAAPEYKPEESLEMVDRWFNYSPL